MTLFIPLASSIPDRDVEVCCDACGAARQLSGLDQRDKQRLLDSTLRQHDVDELHAITFVESILQAYPNTRNQLIRSKVNEKCYRLELKMMQLTAARNTRIDHVILQDHLRQIEEQIKAIQREIADMDTHSLPASDYEERMVNQLIDENPEIHKWLHSIFMLERLKSSVQSRLDLRRKSDNELFCPSCDKGCLYITRPCYDWIYHAVPLA